MGVFTISQEGFRSRADGTISIRCQGKKKRMHDSWTITFDRNAQTSRPALPIFRRDFSPMPHSAARLPILVPIYRIVPKSVRLPRKMS